MVPVRGMEPLRAWVLCEASVRVEVAFGREQLDKGEHGYGMALVQDDGGKDSVPKEGLDLITGDPPVEEGFAVGTADVAGSANSKHWQSVMSGRPRDGQEQGGVSLEDEHSPRCGSALAPCRAALGELGRHPSMIVRHDEGV